MRKLRSGYTTGACAAAAAKGAAQLLLGGQEVNSVTITLPGGQRARFSLEDIVLVEVARKYAQVTVTKDGGDDPDVTNGAKISARVWHTDTSEVSHETIEIIGGKGIGVVTKPGLPLPVGAYAINPIPLEMIRAEIIAVVQEHRLEKFPRLTVEISIPNGRELAKKTLNERLGIVGGLSILGTTGIVRPISAEAWTATISTAMDVAVANGNNEIVLSTGRTSEAALEKIRHFQPEALVMMGDYLEYALKEAGKHGFYKLHVSAMWAKMLKAAMHIPQTHVRFGMLEATKAIAFINSLPHGLNLDYLHGANTAREIYHRLVEKEEWLVIETVCQAAQQYHQEVSGIETKVYLVNPSGTIALIV